MAARRRGAWSVTALNGIVAAVVLILVAVLALVVKPPAPPGIAAFAPQANKPITKAPTNQSAQFGNGAGQCGAGQVCTGPSAKAAASSRGAARPLPTVSPPALTGALPPGLQCYQWPDGAITQTFDPQSPPCISRWDDAKGNGGATSMGVTGTEIKVALPVATANSTWPSLQPIVDFFNTRFQLYGRKIKIVPVPSQQSDGNLSGKWNDPQLQRADAAQIAAAKPFATLDFLDPIEETGTLPVFLDAMAKAKVVSVNGGEVVPFDTEAGLAKRAPYAWSYYPTIKAVLRNVAAMTCRQLVGKPAIHATDPSYHGKTRKFVVWIPNDQKLGGPLPGLDDLVTSMKVCGAKDLKVVREPTGQDHAAQIASAMVDLKNNGVTSVIFYPHGGNGSPGAPLTTASQVNYHPEWIVIGWSNYNAAFMLNDPASETAGAFGVGAWNKQPVGYALEPWAQAVAAAGGDSSTYGNPDARTLYQELLLLASGIQMAGPHLTPDSFAQALHTTVFPNPGAGTDPYFQARVGFAGDDAVMTDDFTAFWLDSRTTGQQVENAGTNEGLAFCAVGRGLRWDPDTWPSTDSYYQGACR